MKKSNSITILQTSEGNRYRIALQGRLTSDNFHKLSRVLDNLDYRDLNLIIDCSDLEYITSAGLRTLLIARRKLSSDRMSMIHVSPVVREILDTTGYSSLIHIRSETSVQPHNSDALSEQGLSSYTRILNFYRRTEPFTVLVYFAGKSYTWQDLDRGSRIIAQDLYNLGVRKNSHVGILSKNSVNLIMTFLAIQKLGAIAVLLNYSLKPSEIIRYSQLGDIPFLCFGDCSLANTDREKYSSDVTAAGSLITTTYDIGSQIDFCARYEESSVSEDRFPEMSESDDAGIMIFTSGSTGNPKGVLLSPWDCIGNMLSIARNMQINYDDVLCMALPLCHVFGFVADLTLGLYYNLKMVIPQSANDSILTEAIEKYHCTILNAVPTKLISLTRGESFDATRLASLSKSLIGGAGISRAQLLNLRALLPGDHIIHLYGMTEILPIAMSSYDDCNVQPLNAVGKPDPRVRIEIRDPETGAIFPTGQVGEITVRSDSSLVCYYKLDVENQAIREDGWIPTGDLGFFDENGYLTLTGRIKDLIIRGGENISPNEVASCIAELPEIHDVKVVGIPDSYFGEIVAAALVIKDGAEFDRTKTEAHVLSRLAKFKAPVHYIIYPQFPLLSNGKVDMVSLKKDMIQRIILQLRVQ